MQQIIREVYIRESIGRTDDAMVFTVAQYQPEYPELNQYRQEQDRQYKSAGRAGVLWLLLGVGMLGGLIYWQHTQNVKAAQKWEQAHTAQVTAVKPKGASYNHAAVEKALLEVRTNIADLNGDRKINCQDYAALFLRYYPTAQIIYNPAIGPTGHVFNRVSTPDGWLYIEPQAGDVWLMREAWPQYNSVKHLNVEMTARYRR